MNTINSITSLRLTSLFIWVQYRLIVFPSIQFQISISLLPFRWRFLSSSAIFWVTFEASAYVSTSVFWLSLLTFSSSSSYLLRSCRLLGQIESQKWPWAKLLAMASLHTYVTVYSKLTPPLRLLGTYDMIISP